MRIIGGEFRGRSIRTCEGPGYRPATGRVRESIFSMLEARGVRWQGLRVVDMFAGSGSLALESLSRGAQTAWFIEKNRKAAGVIRQNLSDLKLGGARARVLCKDIFTVLSRPPEKPFGLGFIDPPYGKDLMAPALEKALESGWFEDGAFILAEVEARVTAPDEGRLGRLELIADREYGQTRILVWRT